MREHGGFPFVRKVPFCTSEDGLAVLPGDVAAFLRNMLC